MANDQSSFLRDLFDLSFDRYVTTRIIKVLYVLAIIGVGVYAVIFALLFFQRGGAGVVLGLAVLPLVFFVGVIYVRVLLELVMVIFRIARNTDALVRNSAGAEEDGGGSPSGPGPAGSLPSS